MRKNKLGMKLSSQGTIPFIKLNNYRISKAQKITTKDSKGISIQARQLVKFTT